MTREQFGVRFAAARLAAGFATQRSAAERLGIAQPRVAEYESGFRVPRVHELDDIVATLGLDPGILFPSWFEPEDRRYVRRDRAHE